MSPCPGDSMIRVFCDYGPAGNFNGLPPYVAGSAGSGGSGGSGNPAPATTQKQTTASPTSGPSSPTGYCGKPKKWVFVNSSQTWVCKA